MLVTIAAGCASGPEPSIAHIHGEPLEVPARPSDAACDARLRSEPLAAQRIRADLVSALLSVDPAVVNAVAADPTASTALLGIPLTVIEANQVRASGIALDDTLALSYWVSVGAPERFGGIWIDPPDRITSSSPSRAATPTRSVSLAASRAATSAMSGRPCRWRLAKR